MFRVYLNDRPLLQIFCFSTCSTNQEKVDHQTLTKKRTPKHQKTSKPKKAKRKFVKQDVKSEC